MATIKYTIGQEREIVRECDSFKKSIFYQQYKRALNLTSMLVKDIKSESLKIVSFCGDRGEGKTSCMETVANILKECNDETSKAHEFIKSTGCKHLATNKFSVLDTIDPSFFDDSHNLLELIVSFLYNSCEERRATLKFKDKNELISAFQQVKESLDVVHHSEGRSYDSLEELNRLSYGVLLRKRMATLVDKYLEVMHQDVLLIPIDDIDLCINHAFMMCEQIRKYLCIPNCLLFISVNMSQLQEVIAHNINSNNTGLGKEEERAMAKKYINKLLPVSSRIDMPKPYSMGNVKLVMPFGPFGTEHTFESLKDDLLDLIFQNTRYLFYNPIGSYSPIIPNNLRDLMNLVGLLASMTPVSDSRDTDQKSNLKSNKELFKAYFYGTWKNNHFDSELNKELEKLVSFDFGTSLNREVVSVLSSKFIDKLSKRDYEDTLEDESVDSDDKFANSYQKPDNVSQISLSSSPQALMIRSILDSSNFGYNISLGDVFYLFSALESDTLKEDEYDLVFFLKSFYSISLYEVYESITENKGLIYPTTPEAQVGINVIDSRFDNSNLLQQLIGGSYFTYCPGELLPIPTNKPALDIFIFSSKSFNDKLSEVLENLKEYLINIDNADSGWTEDRVRRLNVELNCLEYIILSTKCAIRQKQFRTESNNQLISGWAKLRKNVVPFAYQQFNKQMGFFIFDVMSIFGNLVNFEFAYRRFYQIEDSEYEMILNYDGSLLHQMIAESGKYRLYIRQDDKMEENNHRFLSDMVIRNSEILSAIMNKRHLLRSTKNDSAEEMFSNFFSFVGETKMKTHAIYTFDGGKPASKDDGEEITFHFLEPLKRLFEIPDKKGSKTSENYYAYDKTNNLQAILSLLGREEISEKNAWWDKETIRKHVLKLAKKATTVSTLKSRFMSDPKLKPFVDGLSHLPKEKTSFTNLEERNEWLNQIINGQHRQSEQEETQLINERGLTASSDDPQSSIGNEPSDDLTATSSPETASNQMHDTFHETESGTNQ